jgi:uracil-DNA glycosylase
VKPLLVGEQPSRSGDRYYMVPLSGAVAQALCQMAGIPPVTGESRYGRWTWALYEHFDCINAIERHQEWDVRHAANRLRHEIEEDREVVVLLGNHAREAYAAMTEPAASPFDDVGFYEWAVDASSPTGRREVVVIPHPSALNRTYNKVNARWRAGLVLQAAIQKAKQMHETRL